MIELEKVSGLGEWTSEEKVYKEANDEKVRLYKVKESGRVFLVERAKTIEVRCDLKLAKMLVEKYESVMESRYFGRGGIEIVPSGQLEENEVEDLIRLSYNMSKQEA